MATEAGEMFAGYRPCRLNQVINFTMIPPTQQSSFSSVVTATTCFGPKAIFRWITLIYCHVLFA
jgi:hypothetical protein